MIYVLVLILLATAAAGAPMTCDPAFTALFTPIRPHIGHYEVCTTPAPLGDADGEALEALDAFGTAGPYDRPKLARLYGGTRARVTRSWSDENGEIVSITRISPYLDPSFTRLIPGTLEIRLRISRGL